MAAPSSHRILSFGAARLRRLRASVSAWLTPEGGISHAARQIAPIVRPRLTFFLEGPRFFLWKSRS
jgi:hypothetical protein